MDNKQRELESRNPEDDERARLEEQLREAVAAENFFDTSTGKLWTKLATTEINMILKDITSDKYRENIVGYNNALSDLNAYKKMLHKMQVAGSIQRKNKILDRLDAVEMP